ncbi:hypothetical protein ACWER6_11985 [Streptomyces sp. NPDC004009]
MSRWVVLQVEGQAEALRYTARREVEGTEAYALAVLRQVVNTFGQAVTESGRRRQRRQVFRVSERSYFVRVHNRMSVEESHLTLAELVADTHDDGLPDTLDR